MDTITSEKKELNGTPKIIIGSIIIPGTKYVRSHNKLALMINEKNPNVIIVIGKNKSFSIGLTAFCRSVSTIAASISDTQSK